MLYISTLKIPPCVTSLEAASPNSQSVVQGPEDGGTPVVGVDVGGREGVVVVPDEGVEDSEHLLPTPKGA